MNTIPKRNNRNKNTKNKNNIRNRNKKQIKYRSKKIIGGNPKTISSSYSEEKENSLLLQIATTNHFLSITEKFDKTKTEEYLDEKFSQLYKLRDEYLKIENDLVINLQSREKFTDYSPLDRDIIRNGCVYPHIITEMRKSVLFSKYIIKLSSCRSELHHIYGLINRKYFESSIVEQEIGIKIGSIARELAHKGDIYFQLVIPDLCLWVS